MSKTAMPFFDAFDDCDIEVGEARIHAVVGGAGPPILLLHGYPQTHVMWHKVAPSLASERTVVAADLRGYGASSKPATDERHAPYSKRAMAGDMRELMHKLGFERFDVCGHDRGARVAHRLAADHPEAVARLMVLDVAPTREMYRGTTEAFARAYWHWFFLIQPAPFPEQLILADTDRYLRHKCGAIGSAGAADRRNGTPFDAAAFEAYLAAFSDPATVHASCEDYRAAASIDLEHDDADGDKRLSCPVRVLWGENGIIGRCFDPLALWRSRAEHVSGASLPGGHFLAEELPEAVLDEMTRFFRAPDLVRQAHDITR